MSALDYSAVSKTFASTVALEHFDLGVRDGELISLLGPSGCGKTTALRIAAGFEHPDGGAVRVDGADITRTPAHKRNMGMVFQSYSLFPNLNVESNVAFGLRVRKVSGSERSRRIAEALERVQLSAFAKRYPHQLSGGQQQRVALARALVVEPAVLLLDEPLSALDAKVRTTLREEIRRLQQDVGITTLFVTHDQDEALAISDRVGVMSHGRLEQLGTPREVYSNPASAFVARFVGQINELAGTSNGNGIAVGDRNLPIAPPVGAASGDAVIVLIRPEDIELVELDDPSSPDALPGTVVGEDFAGSSSTVWVRLDRLDTLVSADVAPSSAHQPGQRVGVVLDATRARVETSAAAPAG